MLKINNKRLYTARVRAVDGRDDTGYWGAGVGAAELLVDDEDNEWPLLPLAPVFGRAVLALVAADADADESFAVRGRTVTGAAVPGRSLSNVLP
jgi:hypothetical protein